MTDDEEEPAGPVTLADAMLRTPLHRLPPGFTWGLWVLGGALGGSPILLAFLDGRRIVPADLRASAALSGILVFFHLLFILGGRPRRNRWVRLVYGSIIAALVVCSILDRWGL